MRIGGIASGFDTEQIVTDLMRAERIPLDRLFQQKVRAEWKREEYRTVNSRLLQLRNKVFDMQLQSSYVARKATSSDEGIASVSATGASQTGNYQINVERLATSATVISAKGEDGQGVRERYAEYSAELTEPTTIKLRSTANGDYHEVLIKPGETVDDFVNTINTHAELGVSAYYDEHEDRVVFNSKGTGASAIVEFAVADDDEGATDSFVQSVLVNPNGHWHTNCTGENAQFTINGLSTERESNTFELAGTRITLQGTGSVSLKVAMDTDKAVDNIRSFVDMYNELIDEVGGKLRQEYYRNFPPLTDQEKEAMSDREIELWEEKAKSGLLRNDQILSGILTEMRMAITGAVEGLEGVSSLSDIGIKTGPWFENGKLHLDETKLRSALTEYPDQVMKIFNHNPGDDSGEAGIAHRLHTIIGAGMKRVSDTAGSGGNSYDTSFLSNQIRRFDERMAAMEERLERVESRYWAQFTAMERALSEMYAQSDWLTQQLMAMGG